MLSKSGTSSPSKPHGQGYGPPKSYKQSTGPGTGFGPSSASFMSSMPGSSSVTNLQMLPTLPYPNTVASRKQGHRTDHGVKMAGVGVGLHATTAAHTSPHQIALNDKQSLSTGNPSSSSSAAATSLSALKLFGPNFWLTFWHRAGWLVGLMVLQSLSSFILGRYSDLVHEHFILTMFLTMIVGAGGNASNQSAVYVIRGLAIGNVNRKNRALIVTREAILGLMIGGVLCVAAFIRVYIFHRNVVAALAISNSLLVVVIVANLLGAILPLVFHHFQVDPAHSAPTLQVIMDISGVLITCIVSGLFFRVSAWIFLAEGDPVVEAALLAESVHRISLNESLISSSNLSRT